MTTKLISGLGAVSGCRFLPESRQLIFVERDKGVIGLLDFVPTDRTVIVSQGTATIKGNTDFNLDPDTIAPRSNPDLKWALIDNLKRQMEPLSGASIVNLGKKSFDSLTPNYLQNQVFSITPILGNNDSTNQLVNGDVFAVRTRKGNVAKILVVAYGSDIKIKWVTYKPPNPYRILGTGYYKPNDIAATSDGKTAYITEQQSGPILGGGSLPKGTNLLKVNLEKASRSEATVIYSSKVLGPAIQQICLDEQRQQAYVVEGQRLLRIDLISRQKTVVLDGLDNPRGLLISVDLNYAYISDYRSIRRYSLNGDEVVDIAKGLINPRYLTWADTAQSSIFVTQDQPSRVTIIDNINKSPSVRDVVTNGLGKSPMSVAYVDPTHLLICCDNEIYMGNPMEYIAMPSGFFKGIGRVLTTFIKNGKADTREPIDQLTGKPIYPYLFENQPFGGDLSLNIDHNRARDKYTYYRVKVDNVVRYDTWSDMKFNSKTGKYDIKVDFIPMTILDAQGNPLLDKDGKPMSGFHLVNTENEYMGNSDLAMILDSSSLPNKMQTFSIEFADKSGNLYAEIQEILIDNTHCFAKIEMPKVDGVSVSNECGILKCTPDQELKMAYFASHPNDLATYKWRLGRGGKSAVQADGCSIDYGDVKSKQFYFGPIKVEKLLESCKGAAFYAILDVYAKATNGEYRLSKYDAHYAIAFALVT